MRKFVISDIHGFGNVYYAIMGYLDNISKKEEIKLYINGDLIDRGLESADILLDILKRIKKNKYQIIYLGGNHELLMYQEFKRREKGINSYCNDWYFNGGDITDDGLYDRLHTKNRVLAVVDFISNLAIYHKFEEKIDNKEIVLVHAAMPLEVLDNCNLMIKDNNNLVHHCVWTREISQHISIGNKNYFTIIGHTPNNSLLGYSYHTNQNYLNIDGGCAFYVSGFFEYNHFPLIEICDGYLKILTFNSNNEIVFGNYFADGRSYAYTSCELDKEKELLNNKVKIKKLSINEDGICGYWN